MSSFMDPFLGMQQTQLCTNILAMVCLGIWWFGSERIMVETTANEGSSPLTSAEGDLTAKAPIPLHDAYSSDDDSQLFLANEGGTAIAGINQQQQKIHSKVPGNNNRSTRHIRSSSFSLDQLRFSELTLHGRAKEQEVLLACLKRARRRSEPTESLHNSQQETSSSVKQLILVSGESGTGKTSQISITLEKPVRRMGGIFAIGKYDLQQRSEPYLGIISVWEKIFFVMVESNTEDSVSTEKLDAFRMDLKDSLGGSSIKLLAQIIPSIITRVFEGTANGILDFESDFDSDSDSLYMGKDLQAGKAKLHFAFRLLFRALVKHYEPIVMVLDDLQWADPSSLELIEDLLSDPDNRNLILIGIYRSEEVIDNDESHPTAKTIHDLRAMASKSNPPFSLSEIKIGNVDVQGVEGIILDLLSVDSSSATMGLAKICHRRTSGNVFFVLSFLRMLREIGFLEFSLGLMKWTWDISKIENETSAMTNVVALTKRKMETLTEAYQAMLVLSSCLGHKFEKSKLCILVEDRLTKVVHDFKSQGEYVDEFLGFAVKEGFLEGPSGGELMLYRWIHDSIQEAAGSLMAEKELAKLKYDVGKSLLRELESKELKHYVFTVVGLLNPYALQFEGLKDAEKETLAALNLKAATRSIKFSAFESASKFAERGISFLPVGHWESHQKLSLGLFTVATEAEGSQMHGETMMKYGMEVLNQKQVTLLEKMRVYQARLTYLAILRQDGSAIEGLDLCLDVLELLGCSFPKTKIVRMVQLFSGIFKHKRELPQRTADEVAGLPILKSTRLQATDRLLGDLSVAAITNGRAALFGLCVMKQIAITLEHGIHENSHQGFSTLASLFFIVFGDLKIAKNSFRYALLLKERMHGARSVPGFCSMRAIFSLPWSHPWSASLKLLREGYESGVREGERDAVIYCAVNYSSFAFYSGFQLGRVHQETEEYVLQTTELKTDDQNPHLIMYRRMMEVFFATSDNGTSYRDYNLMRDLEVLVSNDDFLRTVLIVCQLTVYYIFGYHEKSCSLIRKNSSLSRRLGSHCLIIPATCYQCFGIYATVSSKASSSVNRRQLKRLGLKKHKVLRRWANDGCCNVVHYVALLDAELAVLNGAKEAEVEDLYQKAIVLASRGGFIQDAAVANERLAGFFQARGDMMEAGRRYEQAIQYYEEWGCTRKSSLVRTKQKDCLSTWSTSKR